MWIIRISSFLHKILERKKTSEMLKYFKPLGCCDFACPEHPVSPTIHYYWCFRYKTLRRHYYCDVREPLLLIPRNTLHPHHHQISNPVTCFVHVRGVGGRCVSCCCGRVGRSPWDYYPSIHSNSLHRYWTKCLHSLPCCSAPNRVNRLV